jgi:predicted ATPase
MLIRNGKFAIPLEAGSSTGKTSLIRELARRGFPTIGEVATDIIEHEKLTPDHGRHVFQARCLERQLEVERVLHQPPFRYTFLDRGLLIGPAHFVYDGLPVPDVYEQLDVGHYAMAIIVEPLETFEHNGIRPAWEDIKFSRRMTDLVEAEYRKRGIFTVRLPVIKAATKEQAIALRCDLLLQLCRTHLLDLQVAAPMVVPA